MAKYTDEQIKKAFFPETDREKELLDLINRQNAEIERLQTEADRYKRYYFNHEYDKLIATAKSEAIKEFAERLKAIFPKRTDRMITIGELHTLDRIDCIVKEMVGEGE